MPDLRAILLAAGAGGSVGGYLTLWWHWPLAIGWGLGFVFGGFVLVGTMSVARDPSIADKAWRDAAPEFVDPPAEPEPGVGVQPAVPRRNPDVPSGD